MEGSRCGDKSEGGEGVEVKEEVLKEESEAVVGGKGRGLGR